MTTKNTLLQRLENGDLIMLDGGTGTEMERVGAPMHSGVWCAAATGSHPHLVKKVHKNYIAAGADIITTNTYASGRQALAKNNLEEHFEAWNSAAIALAHEAREEAYSEMGVTRPLYIAGSIAPFDHWGKEYDEAAMRAAFREQAELLAAGNVDFLMLEMLGSDIQNTLAAIEEGKKTSLPVWVSISCLDHIDTGEMFYGAREEMPTDGPEDQFRYDHGPLAAAIQTIAETGIDVLSVMHSEIRIMVPALEIVRQHWSGPLGAYPNAGHWERPNWEFKESVSAEFYAAEAKKWVSAGAQIIGGCCGVGQEQIEATVKALRPAI